MARAAVAIGWALLCASASAAEERFDIVVYGGTSGGVAAAVQAARMGRSVVLIEPGRHLGGLSSGGLGATDIGNKQAIGGIAREFYQRIWKHYQQPAAWTRETREEYAAGRAKRHAAVDSDTMWTFEPHVAAAVFEALVAEARVPVVRGQRLNLAAGVQKEGARITALVMESGRVFRGGMFIDASYEGDLMAKAGVAYHVGREANAQYQETLNGVQLAHAKHHQFIQPVDPFVRPGDRTSGLLPGVHPGSPGAEGQGDHRVQAYNFRICTTDVPENRRAWPQPADYDPRRYELLLRNCEAGDPRVPWAPTWMPNRKTDTNNNFAISTDNIGMNYDYPDGDYATRERIFREHVSYQQGLLWTLANSPRVPPQIREHFQRLGLAKDEFVDSDNWPHQMYVREARRMKSDYVMTEHECTGRRLAPEPVGLAAYNMDSHHTQRYVDAQGHARNEGDVQVGVSPYPIAYRSIVPAARQCTNLLVPVCMSSSHIAYGSIRMEPVFMVLGQSAATAAALALDARVDVQQVDYPQLRARLLADRQILEWTGPKRRAVQKLDPQKLPGVVLDDVKADFQGEWLESQSAPLFLGDGYRHDGNADKAGKTVRFTVQLPRPGRYEVRLAYTPNANRAARVPVVVQTAQGPQTVVVNQTQPPPIDGLFASLGTFDFGATAVVSIDCKDTRGYVVVDGLQLLPQ